MTAAARRSAPVAREEQRRDPQGKETAEMTTFRLFLIALGVGGRSGRHGRDRECRPGTRVTARSATSPPTRSTTRSGRTCSAARQPLPDVPGRAVVPVLALRRPLPDPGPGDRRVLRARRPPATSRLTRTSPARPTGTATGPMPGGPPRGRDARSVGRPVRQCRRSSNRGQSVALTADSRLHLFPTSDRICPVSVGGLVCNGDRWTGTGTRKAVYD